MTQHSNAQIKFQEQTMAVGYAANTVDTDQAHKEKTADESSMQQQPSTHAFDEEHAHCAQCDANTPWEPDQLRGIQLLYVASGRIQIVSDGKDIEIKAGKLCVFWEATPHKRVHITSNCHYFKATIPLHSFFTWRLPGLFVKQLLSGQFVMEHCSKSTPIDKDLFLRWTSDTQNQRQQAMILEMQARLTRFALESEPPLETSRWVCAGSSSSSKVAQMAMFIAHKYTQNINVDTISAHVGLHPNYAMNLFQKTFRTTMLNCLTSHRVSHAQDLLASTNENITDIAYASGFQSISRFNSAFQNKAGCTPRQYRKNLG